MIASSPIKRQRFTEWIKKMTHYMLLTRNYSSHNSVGRLKVKGSFVCNSQNLKTTKMPLSR